LVNVSLMVNVLKKSYLSPSGLTVVQVAQVKHSKHKIGKVEIFLQRLQDTEIDLCQQSI